MGLFDLKRIIAFAFAAALSISAAARAETMLVFDGSNSMWDEIDNVTKINIAKDAIDTLLDAWLPNEPLGLVAYGHRDPRSCTDSEILAPAGSTFGTIRRAVNNISPRGRTPLANALMTASEALLLEGQPNPNILLLTDGTETCGGNICKFAESLKANWPDFIVHLISFNMSAEERKQLHCLPALTGGVGLIADTRAELNGAMIEMAQIIGTPSHEAEVTAEPTQPSNREGEPQDKPSLFAESAQAPASPPPPPKTTKTTTTLTDRRSDTQSLIQQLLSTVTGPGVVTSSLTPVSQALPTEPAFLPSDAGDRNAPSDILEERTWETVAQSLNALGSNQTDPDDTSVFAFGSAQVSFLLSLAEGLEPTFALDRPLWTLYERRGQAKGRQVLQSRALKPVFDLAIGDYLMVLEAENIRYNYGFSVKDTLPRRHVISLNLGQLEIKVVNDDIIDLYAFRFERGPKSPSLDLKVQGPWSHPVLLPAGTYIVQGRMPDQQVTVGPLTVEAGKTTTAELQVR